MEKKAKVKIVLIGDGAVGKTSIVKQYLEKGFDHTYDRTIAAECYVQKDKFQLRDDTVTLTWSIWDLAGQPSFKNVRDIYYRGAKAALLVFDISRPETFFHLSDWINEFWEHTGSAYPFVLIGNKNDLRGKRDDTVSPQKGKLYAQKLTDQYGYSIPYIETSAKEDVHIDKAFEQLAQLLFNIMEAKEIE